MTRGYDVIGAGPAGPGPVHGDQLLLPQHRYVDDVAV